MNSWIKDRRGNWINLDFAHWVYLKKPLRKEDPWKVLVAFPFNDKSPFAIYSSMCEDAARQEMDRIMTYAGLKQC